MKAISINAYEIENDDGETMVFMTPKEFGFIKKQNDLKDKEIERLHSIIKEVREIFKYYGVKENIVGYSNYTITGESLIKLLEILDKVNNDENN